MVAKVDAQQVIDMVTDGMTLRAIGTKLGVDASTCLRHATATPELAQQYARARDAAADLYESDILAAADVATMEDAAKTRVRIDALKWVAARRSPRRYGDKLALGGADDLPAIGIKKIEREIVDPQNSDR